MVWENTLIPFLEKQYGANCSPWWELRHVPNNPMWNRGWWCQRRGVGQEFISPHLIMRGIHPRQTTPAGPVPPMQCPTPALPCSTICRAPPYPAMAAPLCNDAPQPNAHYAIPPQPAPLCNVPSQSALSHYALTLVMFYAKEGHPKSALHPEKGHNDE